MTHSVSEDIGEALAERLVRTALEALADTPAELISLRRVAQDVGVSHQAPYVHFGSKRRFLAAVAGAGLHQCSAQTAAALAASGQDPLLRLHALLDSYISFVRERPHVHDLAYGPLVAKSDHPSLQQGAIENWDLLYVTVAACQPAGTGEAEILKRCAAGWGTVYGIARLITLDQIPASVPGGPDQLLHDAIDTLYQGWRAGH